MAHINLNHLTPAQAESRADFDCEADWLHDETIQCECCCEFFDSAADFADDLRVAGWVCIECEPDYLADVRATAAHERSYAHGVL